MSEEDYETAANHIHRYLNLDKESFKLKNESTTDLNEKAYLDQSFKLLQDSKTKLQEIVKQRYDQAVAANDIPQMERFFKIFPLIGEAENGLGKFCAYLCSQISDAAEKNFQILLHTDRTDQRWEIMFADALILLFEKVARVIEAYQPLIESCYGHGHMFLFIRNIQKECDKQAVRILDKFKQVRGLNSIFSQVQQSMITSYSSAVAMLSASSSGSGLDSGVSKIEERLDPRTLDPLLTELTLISARTELYKNFLIKSIHNDLNGQAKTTSPVKADEHSKPQQSVVTINEVQNFINQCNLRCAVQELIGQYSTLENYFMVENIFKAIQIDQIRRDSLTSSVVDDAFFIIKKCVK